MSYSVIFSRNLKRRLVSSLRQQIDDEVSFGCLYGFSNKQVITVIGAISFKESSLTDCKIKKDELSNTVGLLPIGMAVVGVFRLFKGAKCEDDITSWIRFPEITDFLNSVREDIHGEKQFAAATIINDNFDVKIVDEEKLSIPSSVTFSDWNILYQNTVCIRVKGSFPLTYSCNKDAGMNFDDSIRKLLSDVESGYLWYHLKNSSLMMNCANEELDMVLCNELHDYLDVDLDGFGGPRKQKKKAVIKPLLEVEILKRETNYSKLDRSQISSPVLHYKKVQCKSYTIPLIIDAIVCTPTSTPLSDLIFLLNKSVTDQLTAIQRCFDCEGVACDPRPKIFRPIFCDHYVTLVYPNDRTDADLESVREKIQSKLLLAADRPVFRLSNVYDFCREYTYPYLLNPHDALTQSPLEDGEVSTVDGTYSYHHYMQDGFDDNQWGCAYRSLQTVISWFRHQGYTTIDVPSHTSIQKALVDVGDKPANFVGTKKWIGSTEVGYCLDSFLGVTSKIMFVSSGADLANKGRELANHFKTQGTPVMIGGGVLAHTIIGIDWSEKTGDIRFLILDPHYTGGEDINIVCNKGWCGWKGPDFWDKSAYYNLCMPQRPSYI